MELIIDNHGKNINYAIRMLKSNIQQDVIHKYSTTLIMRKEVCRSLFQIKRQKCKECS